MTYGGGQYSPGHYRIWGYGGDASGDLLMHSVGTDSTVDFENIIGSAHVDTLAGDGNDNIIEGGGGSDTLYGRGGNDTLSYEGSGSGVTVNLDVSLSGGGRGGGCRFRV